MVGARQAPTEAAFIAASRDHLHRPSPPHRLTVPIRIAPASPCCSTRSCYSCSRKFSRVAVVRWRARLTTFGHVARGGSVHGIPTQRQAGRLLAALLAA